MKLFAQFVSFLFHPALLVALVPFLAVYQQTTSRFTALKWGMFTSLFILFGLIVFLAGRFFGIFSDFDLTKKEERGKFYLIAELLGSTYLAIALVFRGLFFHLTIGALGIILGTFLFMLVNKRLKASIHVAIISAFVSTISLLFGKQVFFATFWIVPLIAWARLRLERHSTSEVIAGGVLGIVITFLTFLLGKFIYTHPV